MNAAKRTSETEKVREALATRISGFPLIAAREQDDQGNTLARAAGSHSARRFTGQIVTGFGALCLAASAHSMDMNDSWTGADKTKHVFVGAAIGGVVTAATKRPMYGFVAGTVVGVVKELADSRSAGHHSSLQDAIVTSAGAAMGAYTGGVVITYFRGRAAASISKEF